MSAPSLLHADHAGRYASIVCTLACLLTVPPLASGGKWTIRGYNQLTDSEQDDWYEGAMGEPPTPGPDAVSDDEHCASPHNALYAYGKCGGALDYEFDTLRLYKKRMNTADVLAGHVPEAGIYLWGPDDEDNDWSC